MSRPAPDKLLLSSALASLLPRRGFLTSAGLRMIHVKPGSVHVAASDVTHEEEFMEVAVDEGYYLTATPVTQGQWLAVMGGVFHPHCDDDCPMSNVEWPDAMEFCRRLTGMDRETGRLPAGYVYTLPTEMQWEYACRAGTAADFVGPIEQMAWYRDNSGGEPHPVGRKRPNRWGFYDMHGNVLEWCRHLHAGGHAFRGGCWRDSAYFCRAGMRLERSISIRFVGFRPAAVLEKSGGDVENRS